MSHAGLAGGIGRGCVARAGPRRVHAETVPARTRSGVSFSDQSITLDLDTAISQDRREVVGRVGPGGDWRRGVVPLVRTRKCDEHGPTNAGRDGPAMTGPGATNGRGWTGK